MALSSTETLSSDMQSAAKRAAETSDSLTQADYFVVSKRYSDAIEQATAVLAERSLADDRRQRAGQIVVRANAIMGKLAFERQDYAEAKRHFFAAVNPRLGSPRGAGLVNLGLNLAYQFHEDANGMTYADAYDVLFALKSLATDPTVRNSVGANLAEASLTTGRFDEAVRIGRELLGRQLDATSQLNMKFIVYAALTLDRQMPEAARAGEELAEHYAKLPAGFINDWEYGGTRAYIERAAAPAADKKKLLDTITQIETPK
jgi:tetratricopeptide (TPR) repeat protein